MQEGSLFTALSGALSLRRRLDTVANNLANASTTGYKADRLHFDGVLSDLQKDGAQGPGSQITFPVVGSDFTNHGQGTLKSTGRKLDFAIQGDGFFRVRAADGGEAFTRDGRFQINREGQLVDVDGRPVLNPEGEPIALSTREVEVNEEGRIFSAQDGTALAQLGVKRAEDPQLLEKRGSNLYTSPDGNMVEDGVGRVRNGSLEGSNVNSMEEMVHMIDLQRSFESITKGMRTIDESYSRSAERLAGAQ